MFWFINSNFKQILIMIKKNPWPFIDLTPKLNKFKSILNSY